MLKDFCRLTDGYENIKIKSNYHTHNFLCGHADGTVCDYVKQAVLNGLEEIGISDHCVPFNGGCGQYMTEKTMDFDYLPQFETAKQIFGEKIRILKAVEIEYFEGNDDFYKRLLKKLDYLVMGQHEYMLGGKRKNSFADGTDEENVLAYIDNVIKGIKTDCFSIIAHPDLIFYHSPEVTEKIAVSFEELVIQAKKHGVALELNANGIRSHGFRYPTDLLVELIKKHNAETVVSSDCHSPKLLCDKYEKQLTAYAANAKLPLIQKLNLKK